MPHTCQHAAQNRNHAALATARIKQIQDIRANCRDLTRDIDEHRIQYFCITNFCACGFTGFESSAKTFARICPPVKSMATDAAQNKRPLVAAVPMLPVRSPTTEPAAQSVYLVFPSIGKQCSCHGMLESPSQATSPGGKHHVGLVHACLRTDSVPGQIEKAPHLLLSQLWLHSSNQLVLDKPH